LQKRKFHHIFANKKFKGMKKKIFAILFMASLAFNVCSATLGSINYFTVSVDGSDMSFPAQPSGRGPAQNIYDVYAVYNSGYETLCISFQEELGCGSIILYRNGNEIIYDNTQMNYGDVISYDLSEYGNGEYVIVITTNNGEIYIGFLNIDSI